MSGFSRREFLRWQGYLGLAAVTPPALWRASGGWSAVAAAAPSSMPMFNVQDYGAFPNGMDATAGFKKAVSAAQAVSGGATVYVPKGTYMFTSRVAGPYSASVQIHKLGAPIVFTGDGPGLTVLQEQVTSQTLISVRTDGTIIEGMTLDCQSYQGGSCLGVGSVGLDSNNNAIGGNYITLQDCTALGSNGNKRFTLFFAGPPGASQAHQFFQSYNTVKNCTVHDQIDDDGFSFSFQNYGTITGITHFGSRLAIFECDNLTVDTYSYSPNNACNQGAAQGIVTNGFWITPPSNNIVIKDFTTSGNGGIISGLAQERIATNIQIINQVFTGVGNTLEIGNAQGVTIQGGQMKGNTLLFNPGNPGVNSPPGYPAGSTSIVVQDTELSHVRVQTAANDNHPTRMDGPPLVDAQFVNCTFDATPIPGSQFQPTFWDLPVLGSSYPPGPATFTIQGGTFANQAGGLALGTQVTSVAACAIDGTTVTLTLDTDKSGLAVGELMSVAEIGGFTAHAPNGVFAVQSLVLDGPGGKGTTTVTYVSTPEPVGTYSKGSGRITGVPGWYANVVKCQVSGTTTTLYLDGIGNLSADETIIVSGIKGFGDGDPNGTYTIATIGPGGSSSKDFITYDTPTAPSGSYSGGGSVLCIPMAFSVSGTAPINIGRPVVSGTATPGHTLSADPGDYMPQTDGTPTFTYQWSNGQGPISGATGPTYTLSSSDVGSNVGVTVTATNSNGASSASSQPVTVNSNP